MADENLLKTNGIVYFPPVKTFDEAIKIYNECGGVIIPLEEDGFLVDEVDKISKLYGLSFTEIEALFRMVLTDNSVPASEVDDIIENWNKEELTDKK